MIDIELEVLLENLVIIWNRVKIFVIWINV